MAILIKDNIEINSNQPGSNGGIIAKTVIKIKYKYLIVYIS